MKVSLLIIAHNEEKHISECLASLRNQTQKSDETILIAHNCTDSTIQKAGAFPEVTIIEHQTDEVGPFFARIRGFQEVTGDIIVCIDGDAFAHQDWLRNMVQPFTDPQVVWVGGYVWFFGSFWQDRVSFLFFYLKIWKPWYFWWASFAVRRTAFDEIWGWTPLEKAWKYIPLTCPTEDAYLSLSLAKIGRVVCQNSAKINVHFSDFFSSHGIERDMSGDKKKLIAWLR